MRSWTCAEGTGWGRVSARGRAAGGRAQGAPGVPTRGAEFRPRARANLLGYITHRLNPSPLPARRLDAAPRRPAERVAHDAQLELGVVVLPLRLRRARDLPHESVGARRQLLWSSAATQLWDSRRWNTLVACHSPLVARREIRFEIEAIWARAAALQPPPGRRTRRRRHAVRGRRPRRASRTGWPARCAPAARRRGARGACGSTVVLCSGEPGGSTRVGARRRPPGPLERRGRDAGERAPIRDGVGKEAIYF